MPNAHPVESPPGSILDRVLSSQHAAAIEGFVPLEIFSMLMKSLSDKEQNVLRRRFGLHGNDPQTLEEIGRIYAVTRERIRQIENTAVQKIRSDRLFHETIAPVERLLLGILNSHGGAMEEQNFFQATLAHAGNTTQQQRALAFFLSQLLNSYFEYQPSNKDFRTLWKLRAQSFDIIHQSVRVLQDIIRRYGHPITREELIRAFRSTELARQHGDWLTEETISSYLHLSMDIGHNPFGEYGLTSWGTVTPRRMNDKIYLILKKHGQPLHFTDIARRINEAGFDARKAYPPTVHNELILNNQYVLVGRGIYALKEWGYKPGVVADVLVSILREAARPMSRDELVAAVLKQRLVKRNTILLALTNKKIFQRLPSGEYLLTKTE